MVVEAAESFRRGRKPKKRGLDSADASELFFEDVMLPAESLLGTAERQGFAQMMTELPQERLIVACGGDNRARARARDRLCQAAQGLLQGDHRLPEQPVRAGRVQERGGRGQGVPRSLHRPARRRPARYRDRLMAKSWLSDPQGKIIDRRLQLFGGYGYMDRVSDLARVYRDARVLRIYAGTNEIMKLLIARSL
jgi:acyl-CoA dehydrogenase